MIRDKHLDAFITVTGYPNASIVEMAATQGAELVTVSGSQRDALIKKAPFYSKAVIPGGTYKGNNSDVETVAVGALGYHVPTCPRACIMVLSKDYLETKKRQRSLPMVMLKENL